jgi:CheY-like chemotaxis protein
MRGPASFRKANVLAVDDNPGNLLSLDAVLGAEHNFIGASSGAEAVSIATQRDDIDVVLMDVQMPTMDGFDAAERIKRIPHAANIPIIFITAVYTEDPYIKRGYDVGGLDYFTKPFDPELLKQKVRIYTSYRMNESRDRSADEPLNVGKALSTLLELLPAGVLVSDAEGRIEQMTDEAARVLRTTATTRRGVYGQLIEWWNDEGRVLKELGSPLDRALRHGESTHGERVSLLCIDRSLKTLLVSALPLNGAAGEVDGAVMVIRDSDAADQIGADLEAKVTPLLEDTIH